MENQEAGRSNSEKAATESLGILANGAVPNAGLYDQPPQIRQPGQFPQLISNEHVQLPPTAQFGMGHHFVPQFPTYMHAVPTGMYSLNMMEDQGDNSGKRRRRTNYRDPENAAKLTTALGILIKQKEENKPQDLKSIASHFGLPYNTLRDNYLKVTTGRLLKDRGEKRPVMKTEAEEAPGSASKIAKKASVPQQPGSNNSSANNTPRESSAGGAGASSSAPPHTQPMPVYGSGLPVSGALPGQGQGPNGQHHQQAHQLHQAQQFSPYPVFHPQMGMHFMPQMQAQLQHMNMQMANGGVGGVMQGGPMNTMHHPMLAGPPQMMHMFAPAPLGYQINPANGRPFPVYATGGPPPQGSTIGGAGGAGVGGDLQAQMQGQLMNPGMLSMTLPAPIAIPNNNPSNNTTNNNNNGNTNTEGDTSPTTSNTSSNPTSNANSNTSGTLASHPHAGQPVHMVPAMGMGLSMPGMYLPMQGPPGPMFAPPMYAHGVQGGAAGSGGGFPMYANAHLFHPSMGMNQVQGAGNNSNNNQAHLVLDGTNTNHTHHTINTNNTNNISSATAAVVTPSANSASYLAAAMTAAYPEVSAGAIGSAGAGTGGGRSVNGSGAAPAAVAVNTTTNSSNSTATTTASTTNSATTEEDKKETEAEAERAAQSAEAKADIGKGGDGKKDRDSAAATTTTKTVTASAGGSAAAAVGKRK